MALATTCPQCKTSFKVVPDQLKLRRGLVRCGVCRHVFSGIDFLRYIEDGAGAVASLGPSHAGPRTPTDLSLAPPPPVPAGATAAAPAGAAGAMAPATDLAPGDAFEVDLVTLPVLPPGSDESEPWLGAGGRDAPGAERGDEDDRQQPSPPGAAGYSDTGTDTDIDTESETDKGSDTDAGKDTDHDTGTETGLAPRPALAAEAAPGAPEDDAVDFFASERRARGFSSRAAAFGWFCAILLALALAVQATIGTRHWLAAWFPWLKPAMTAAFEPFGLALEPPRDIASLTIESFELQAAGTDGLFAVSALLRNRAAHPVYWPSLELTLTDGAGAVVVRKVLQPADYLGTAARADDRGIGARAELPVRIALQARDISPTGYTVNLFYQ
jgi:predicted Zn finger-like uncharacterized protein